MIVYLAGGMKSGWQQTFIEALPHITFVDPRSHGLTDPKDYTKWDMQKIKESDLLIAYLEPSNPSGLGMALEIGYALGLGIPVWFVCEKNDKYADMLKHGVTVIFDNLNDMVASLAI